MKKWFTTIATVVALSALCAERLPAQSPVDMQGVDSGLVVRAWTDAGTGTGPTSHAAPFQFGQRAVLQVSGPVL